MQSLKKMLVFLAMIALLPVGIFAQEDCGITIDGQTGVTTLAFTAGANTIYNLSSDVVGLSKTDPMPWLWLDNESGVVTLNGQPGTPDVGTYTISLVTSSNCSQEFTVNVIASACPFIVPNQSIGIVPLQSNTNSPVIFGLSVNGVGTLAVDAENTSPGTTAILQQSTTSVETDATLAVTPETPLGYTQVLFTSTDGSCTNELLFLFLTADGAQMFESPSGLSLTSSNAHVVVKAKKMNKPSVYLTWKNLQRSGTIIQSYNVSIKPKKGHKIHVFLVKNKGKKTLKFKVPKKYLKPGTKFEVVGVNTVKTSKPAKLKLKEK